MMNRRRFLKNIGNVVAMASMPLSVCFASSHRITIVGGGVAGTHAAAYMKLSVPSSHVSVIDPMLNNYSENSFFAIQNKYRPVSPLVLQEMGVELINDRVMMIDPTVKSCYLENGNRLHSDFIIVSSGVDFKWEGVIGYLPGMENQVTHAWQHPSREIDILKQIDAMKNGGLVVVSVPRAPFRFQKGPYIRSTHIADYLTKFKPRSKLIILDNNDYFPSMDLFFKKWSSKFPTGMLEWVSASNGGALERLDSKNNTVYTSLGRRKADVLNFIPPQQAGAVARNSGLNFESDWCQVCPYTLESDHYQNVFVIGDANNANLSNKTAEVADQQARNCVNYIKRMIT